MTSRLEIPEPELHAQLLDKIDELTTKLIPAAAVNAAREAYMDVAMRLDADATCYPEALKAALMAAHAILIRAADTAREETRAQAT